MGNSRICAIIALFTLLTAASLLGSISAFAANTYSAVNGQYTATSWYSPGYPDGNSAYGNTYNGNPQPFDARQAVEKYGMTAISQVQCATGSECPEALGRLHFYQQAPKSMGDVMTQSDSCFAFLISPDTVMTNSHCAPPDNLVQFASIRFVNDGKDSDQTAQVQKVLFKGDKTKYSDYDVALLKLTHPINRKPIPIRAATLDSNQQYFAFRNIDNATTMTSQIRSKKCTPTESTLVNGHQYLGIEFPKCPDEPGDSGGPILDNEGNLVALAWGGPLDGSETMAINTSCLPSPDNLKNWKGTLNSCLLNTGDSATYQARTLLNEAGEKLVDSANLQFGVLHASGTTTIVGFAVTCINQDAVSNFTAPLNLSPGALEFDEEKYANMPELVTATQHWEFTKLRAVYKVDGTVAGGKTVNLLVELPELNLKIRHEIPICETSKNTPTVSQQSQR